MFEAELRQYPQRREIARRRLSRHLFERQSFKASRRT
jgi:hypothetical protein